MKTFESTIANSKNFQEEHLTLWIRAMNAQNPNSWQAEKYGHLVESEIWANLLANLVTVGDLIQTWISTWTPKLENLHIQRRNEVWRLLKNELNDYIQFGWTWNYTGSAEERDEVWTLAKARFQKDGNPCSIVWVIGYATKSEDDSKKTEALKLIKEFFINKDASEWITQNTCENSCERNALLKICSL